MKIVNQSWQWMQKPVNPLTIIEAAGRTCYKSEARITKDSAFKFVKHIIALGHESVIEHVSASVRLITNRSTILSLVRHRLCSFSQESTRYIKYSDITFIRPVWFDDPHYSEKQKDIWCRAMETAAKSYIAALEAGDKPEQAREILPNSLKAELVITANLREWRHIFDLRCSDKAHPQVRELMGSCLQGFAKEVPVLFDDLVEKYLVL